MHSIVATIFGQSQLAYQVFGGDSSYSHGHPLRDVLCRKHVHDDDTMILDVDGNALTNPWIASFTSLICKHDCNFQFSFHAAEFKLIPL